MTNISSRNYGVFIVGIIAYLYRNQYIFTENSAGAAVGITGKIEHEANAGPVVDADYRRIMQLRTKNALDETNARQAQVIQGRDRNLIATAGNQWDAGAKFMARGRAKKT